MDTCIAEVFEYPPSMLWILAAPESDHEARTMDSMLVNPTLFSAKLKRVFIIFIHR